MPTLPHATAEVSRSKSSATVTGPRIRGIRPLLETEASGRPSPSLQDDPALGPGASEHTWRMPAAARLSHAVTPVLIVVEGGWVGQRFSLCSERRAYVVGRGELADVCIDDETVSRSHASVTIDGAVGRARSARVIDLHSSNGTFVNGKRVESAGLSAGDKLQVGRVVLRFDVIDDADATYIARYRSADEFDARRASDSATLDRALAQLWLAFQPIVSVRERRIVGWEALVRSDEPRLARPDLLLPAAENLGRVHDVGRAVRKTAAGFVNQLPGDAYLAVNLHPLDLDDPELLDPLAPLSKVASRVVLEITEQVSIELLRNVEARVAALRALGFRFAIDDVGAGYAGLGTVTRIVPDVVKVDRSIVRDVDTSRSKEKVIQSLLALCKDIGATMVLEGVETHAECRAISALGCDLMQGYYFARPHDRAPTGDVKL